jgi:hypothetical protein
MIEESPEGSIHDMDRKFQRVLTVRDDFRSRYYANLGINGNDHG